MNKLMYYFDEGPIPLATRSALLRKLFMIHFLNGNFHEVLRTMEIVRLGQGVDQNKAFHPDAIARTLTAVKSFKENCKITVINT